MVCPYSLDVPGGVQSHVRGLALALRQRGHVVRVLAPGTARAVASEADADVPRDTAPAVASVGAPPEIGSDLSAPITYAGRAVPLAYNGSVARLAFGPRVALRTRRWLANGDFDLLHVHEPTVPSVSLLALRASTAPVVATFHTSTERSRMLESVEAMLRPTLARLAARIAVSETARATLVHHVGGDPIVIPNGVDVGAFAHAKPRSAWSEPGPALVFLGRFDEPRKGLAVVLEAFALVSREWPDARLLIAGQGASAGFQDHSAPHGHWTADTELRPEVAARVRFLGPVSDADRADLLASAAVYVAPQTRGESFGIVLLEAMAAGAPVVASNLPAFASVLGQGRCGELFRSGDSAAASVAISHVLRNRGHSQRLRRAAADEVRSYDWSQIVPRIETVYDSVLARRRHV